MYNNNHMFYAGPLPIYGCSCPACMSYRKQNVTVGDYGIPVPIDWTYLWNKYSTPYIGANEESVPTPPYEYKEMANDVLPSGVYRINYSIVDNYGFASTHSVVLKTQAGETPMEALSDFMNVSEGYVRYDLIEYFLVRWENGEYVRV